MCLTALTYAIGGRKKVALISGNSNLTLDLRIKVCGSRMTENPEQP